MVAAPFRRLVETRSLKETNIVRRFPRERKIGQDFADEGAEFEGVTGTATRKDDMRVLRMFVDYPIIIGGEGIEANTSCS